MRLTAACTLLALTLLALTMTGCTGHQQSALNPAASQSDRIATLGWFFFWLLGAIFLAVIIALLGTLTRARAVEEADLFEKTHRQSEEVESKLLKRVTAATIASLLVIFILIISSVSTGKLVSETVDKRDALTIEVTGTQWWWQVRYLNADPSRILVTANEIHLPVGRPVQIRGLSNDVIHSFWVPNLNGKRDLIPSRVTTEWIEADHPGIYRGQCAEFCGLQHAHMAIWVVAETKDKFNSWLNAQLQSSVLPANAVQQRGRQVFLNNACVFCHQIRGTTAGGQNAPDLTHFGSRLGIAANSVPNTKGNLAGWIVDPQSTKPGNHMATIAVASTDLQPLVEYLESLK